MPSPSPLNQRESLYAAEGRVWAGAHDEKKCSKKNWREPYIYIRKCWVIDAVTDQVTFSIFRITRKEDTKNLLAEFAKGDLQMRRDLKITCVRIKVNFVRYAASVYSIPYVPSLVMPLY